MVVVVRVDCWDVGGTFNGLRPSIKKNNPDEKLNSNNLRLELLILHASYLAVTG